jgi:phosphopantothenoylcysteine decarboxylase/phosphopantothenate--cysteine ligase
MGLALAKEAYRRGAQVTLVHGPLGGAPRLPRRVLKTSVLTAAEMRDAVMQQVATSPDIVIMAAAVADFRPAVSALKKLKKSTNPTSIELTPTTDILLEVGERKGSSAKPFVVGFAVETGTQEELVTEVTRKLERKNADLMVGNLAMDSFDKDTNKVCIVGRSGAHESIDTAAKSVVARRIFDAVVRKGAVG